MFSEMPWTIRGRRTMEPASTSPRESSPGTLRQRARALQKPKTLIGFTFFSFPTVDTNGILQVNLPVQFQTVISNAQESDNPEEENGR